MLSHLVVVVGLPLLAASASLLRMQSSEQLTRRHEVAPAEEDDEIPWYGKASMFHFPRLYAMDVEGPLLLPTLANKTADYVLLEFYAPWCPHCQHFAPDFERLSMAIQQQQQRQQERLGTPSILTATVDCVRYHRTCQQWDVQGFPTLRWGKRTDFLTRSAELDSIDVQPISAEAVASWINHRLHTKLDPSYISRSALIQPVLAALSDRGSTHVEVSKADAHWDAKLGAALFIRFALMDNSFRDRARTALLNFVDLLARRFPEINNQKECKVSYAQLAQELRNLPKHTTSVDVDALEKTWRPCSIDYGQYGEGWRSCRATWPGKRGYTCGLWTLFHMLAAQSDDASALQDFQTMRSAIHHFFSCKECANHFLRIPSPEGASVGRRDVQLWWWNTHNSVNKRVIGIEDRFQDADPQFPKVAWWPPRQVCPSCRRAALAKPGFKSKEEPGLEEATMEEGWDLPEIVNFLDRSYGFQ